MRLCFVAASRSSPAAGNQALTRRHPSCFHSSFGFLKGDFHAAFRKDRSRCRPGAHSLALTALVGLAAAPVHAQNLVKDGDFEQADPGQTVSTQANTTGNPFDSFWVIGGTVGIDQNNFFVYDGSKSLFLNDGNAGTTSSVTQNLATTAGQNYTLSFFAGADFAANELDVTFGGTALAPIVVPDNGFAGPPPGNNGLFTKYTFNVTATGPFTGLTFSSPTPIHVIGGGTLELDDISVTASPVPEASTTVSFGALLALGLGGLVVAAKKKKVA